MKQISMWVGISIALLFFCKVTLVSSHPLIQDHRSGEGSPIDDSDRKIPLSGDVVTIQNDQLLISFDRDSGALLRFLHKASGWDIQQSPDLAQSFRLFVPDAERSYSPVLGARNAVASVLRSPDGQSITVVWKNLRSEYAGVLPITLRCTVTLDGGQVRFEMRVTNKSPYTISSVEWPIIGSLHRPAGAEKMARLSMGYGTALRSSIYPRFDNNHGYFGTNYPMQMPGGPNYTIFDRYSMLEAGKQGLYLGTHERQGREIVRYAYELKPGYGDSFDSEVPDSSSLKDHPVHIVVSAVHLPFIGEDQSATLAPIILSPYTGDWHTGVDIYRRWHASWFHPPVIPAWATKVHSWQQLQINSSEDDLRTRYTDLPRRAKQAADNGIAALQLVGWNRGGQDRGYPSNDTDPRLGTKLELKRAIAAIEAMGVHVILFNKYNFADMTTHEYKKSLYRHMAVDPNGSIYTYPGFMYQTPEQLANINTRHFAVACVNDVYWRKRSAEEFKKDIDLGASGMLYDEAAAHGGANLCFSPHHGHHVPTTLWSGDAPLGALFRDIVRRSVGEEHFLLSGELLNDVDSQQYSLSYFRITAGNIPIYRYQDPDMPMMIAVTGFDDREMINEALRYRYILSYEPENFKGDLSDFPLTLEYGKKVDALRRRYATYVWFSEFRDTLDAKVTVNGAPYSDYSVFRQKNGRYAVVIVNTTRKEIEAHYLLPKGHHNNVTVATPENPLERSVTTDSVKIPIRSVVLLMEH
jgi:hypothetical protein